MKKVLYTILAVLILTLTTTSCGGSGSSGSDDNEDTPATSGVFVNGATITGAINDSSVFIAGRTVTIPRLWVSDHEVTQGEYEAYCTYASSTPNDTYGAGNNYPAYCVNWYDALVYCNKRSIAEGLTPCYTISGGTNPSNWGAVPTTSNSAWNSAICNFNANGYRLPTEAEWEYLARGGNTSNTGQTTYSGSDTIDRVAWYRENANTVGRDDTNYGVHPVKTKFPNALGLYDMSGNVWELCWDTYGTITSSTGAFGISSNSSNRAKCVIRGGAWYREPSYCTVTVREVGNKNDRGTPYGNTWSFRVVRTAQ